MLNTNSDYEIIKLMRNQKGFTPLIMLLGIVLVVSIIAGGVIYLQNVLRKTDSIPNQSTSIPEITSSPTPINAASPTTDVTVPTDWKAFQSQDSKLTLSYPHEWMFLASQPDEYSKGTTYSKNYARFANTTKDVINNPDSNKDITIVSGGLSLFSPNMVGGSEEWINMSENEFYNPESTFWHIGLYGGGVSAEYSKPEKVVLGNNTFMKQLSHFPESAPKMYEGGTIDPSILNYNYHILRGNRVLLINLTLSDKNPNKDTEIKTFEQILSTLKLVN